MKKVVIALLAVFMVAASAFASGNLRILSQGFSMMDDFTTPKTAPWTGDNVTSTPGPGTRVITDTYTSTALLANTGFETRTGDNFGSWTESPGAGGGSVTAETTIVKTGSTSAKLIGGTGSTMMYQCSIPFVPGEAYTISYWAYGNGSNVARVVIASSTLSTYTQYITTPPASWTQYTQTYIAAGGTVNGCIEVRSDTNGGIIYYDDVTVTAASDLVSVSTSRVGQEMLAYPGFEKAGAGGDDVFEGWSESAGGGTAGEIARTSSAGQFCTPATCDPSTLSTSALKLVYSSTNRSISNSSVRVQPSALYEFSFWTRGDGTVAGRVYLWDGASSNYWPSSCSTIGGPTSTGVTGASFQKMTCSFTTSPTATTVALGFVNPSSAGTAYFDDVKLYRVMTPGYLKFDGGKSTWGDPALRLDAFTREPGVLLFVEVTKPNTNQAFQFGSGASGGMLHSQNALQFSSSSTILKYENGSWEALGNYFANVDYRLAVAHRQTGAFYFVNGKLMNVSEGRDSTPIVGIVSSYLSPATVDYIRIPQTKYLPTPLASDGFSGADGAGALTDGKGHIPQLIPLALNSGFETLNSGTLDDNTTDDFTQWVETESAGGGKVEAVTTAKYSGDQSLKLTGGSSQSYVTSANASTVRPGKTYVFTAYAKDWDGTAQPVFGIYDSTASNYVSGFNFPTSTTGVSWNGFTKVEVTFTAPAGCTGIKIVLGAAAGKIAYWDHLSLQQTSEMVGLGSGGSGLAWTGATWETNNQTARTVTNPDADSSTDGGMENWASATNLTSWAEAASGNSTINRESVGPYAGTYSLRMDIDASNSAATIGQANANTAGDWLQVEFYGKASTGSKSVSAGIGSTGGSDPVPFYSRTLTTSWARYLATIRATSNNMAIGIKRQTAASSSLYFDAFKVQKIPASQLFRFLPDAGTPDVVAGAKLTRDGPATQIGLIFRADSTSSPANFVLVYTTPSQIMIDEVIAGVYTNRATTAYTNVNEGQLQVILDGSEIRAFYNGASAGSGTLTTVLTGNFHGLFSTNTGNRADNFFIYPRGTSNEYSVLGSLGNN